MTDVPLWTLVVSEPAPQIAGFTRDWLSLGDTAGGAWGAPAAAPPPPCAVAVKCSVCKSVSDTYDPYLDVALEIRVRPPLCPVMFVLGWEGWGGVGEPVRARSPGR